MPPWGQLLSGKWKDGFEGLGVPQKGILQQYVLTFQEIILSACALNDNHQKMVIFLS